MFQDLTDPHVSIDIKLKDLQQVLSTIGKWKEDGLVSLLAKQYNRYKMSYAKNLQFAPDLQTLSTKAEPIYPDQHRNL